MKRCCVNTDEFDILRGWRRYFHWRAGACKKIKRRINQRERREAKAIIAVELTL